METFYSYDSMMVFGFLSIMLLIGIGLRAKVRFIQRFLFPSCLIGGLLGMVLVNLKLFHIDTSTLEYFGIHLFNISFISIGLTPNEKKSSSGGMFKGSLWMALTQGVTFPLQALIGGLFVIMFGSIGVKLFPTFGFLAPLGFNEGPGQALSFGKVWETMGLQHGATIGLTFATIGFFFAFFVGVPIANWGIRKGHSIFGPKELPKDFLTGVTAKDDEKPEAGRQTIHSGNADTLAFQGALVGLAYVITYLLVQGLMHIIGGDIAKEVQGFFFFFGLVIAILIKWIMEKAGIGYLIDPGIQKRITGWSVDFLIVATVAAIQVQVVWKFILPITLISLICGVLTTVAVMFLGRRLGEYNLERSLAIYGCVTGNVTSGLLLLRIADPDLKTPVAVELALMNIIVAPVILGCLLLVNTPAMNGWNLWTTTAIFAAIGIASLTVLKVTGLWGKKKF